VSAAHISRIQPVTTQYNSKPSIIIYNDNIYTGIKSFKKEIEALSLDKVLTWHSYLRKTPKGGRSMANKISMKVALPMMK